MKYGRTSSCLWSAALTLHSLTSPAPQYLWHFIPLPLLLLSISDISLPYLSCSSVSLTFHSLTSPAPQYLWHFTLLPLLLLSISDISLPYLSCSSVSLTFHSLTSPAPQYLCPFCVFFHFFIEVVTSVSFFSPSILLTLAFSCFSVSLIPIMVSYCRWTLSPNSVQWSSVQFS